MTSAKSCKTAINRRPEKTWFVEILRRYRTLPIIIAVSYFLSNILPVLLAYDRLETVIISLQSTMQGGGIFNMIIGIAGGVAVSCAVFKYLHSAASVIDAHARPLTRTQLFRGSFFAGLVMIIGPIVLTGLFYLCLFGAHTSAPEEQIILSMGAWSNPHLILNVTNVFGWVLDNILVIGYAYCLSCFAAILAGTAVIQALLSILLLGLSTIVYLIFEGYKSTFLLGYNGHEDVTGYLSPYYHLLTRNAYPFSSEPYVLIIHAAIAVLAAFAAARIYKVIKLENEERTIVVPVASDVMVVLLSIISVSVVLFIIEIFVEDSASLGGLISIVLATVVFFPIYCMIADQSFRIFRKRNSKIFLVYAAAMCLILALTMFDISGFEKRVPAAGNVQSIDIEDSNLTNTDFRGIKDKEMISLITALHESIVSAEDADAADKAFLAGGESNKSIGTIKIRYNLKNGKTMSRSYEFIAESSFAEYAAYYDNKATRKQECMDTDHPIRKDEYMCINDARGNQDEYDETIYAVPEGKVRGLAKAVNRDVMNWTAKKRELFIYHEDAEEYNDTYLVSSAVDLSITGPEEMNYERPLLYYAFDTNDKNVNQYIEDNKLLSKKNIVSPDDPRMGGYAAD